MASSSKNLVIVAVAAALVLGGGAAFLLLSGNNGSNKIVEFVGKPETLIEDADSLTSPKEASEVAAHLPKGMSVDVVGIVDGRKWVQVTLPDKRTAYLPVGAVQTGAAGADATAMFQADQAHTVAFDPTSDIYTPSKTVPVYVEPNVQAPQKYEIEAGTGIPAIGRSKDGIWVMASTEDGNPAFLLAADLGSPQRGKAVPSSPSGGAGELPDTIDGAAKVISTSTLTVNDQQVTLFGIEGESGPYAEQLQSIVDSQGGALHCVRQDQQYVCKLTSGIDIALSALFNGGARPTADAPAMYQSQAKAAQTAGRGIWAAPK
jgi:endonuclease YncB( thermonuclease family)